MKNSSQWGLHNTSFGDTSFGQITSASGNRTLQIAAKFYYCLGPALGPFEGDTQ